MSSDGPITNFTDAEKLEFKPIFVKYLNKEYGPKEILQALGGDREKAKRFQGYAGLMIAMLKSKQAHEKVDALVQHRDMLVQRLNEQEAAIASSRQQAAAGAAKHTGDVRVTPTYKQ